MELSHHKLKCLACYNKQIVQACWCTFISLPLSVLIIIAHSFAQRDLHIHLYEIAQTFLAIFLQFGSKHYISAMTYFNRQATVAYCQKIEMQIL